MQDKAVGLIVIHDEHTVALKICHGKNGRHRRGLLREAGRTPESAAAIRRTRDADLSAH